jgi:hypothetical protein
VLRQVSRPNGPQALTDDDSPRALGIELEISEPVANCIGTMAQFLVDAREIVVAISEIGLKFDGRFQVFNGLSQVFQLIERSPKIEVR